MRLTCPNCDAVYEVPDDAVPDEGRDVQCTNCGHSWFQLRPGLARDLGDLDEIAEDTGGPVGPHPEDDPADVFEDDEGHWEVDAAPSERLDPAARRVLEEEAEREMVAREAERGRSRPPRASQAPPEPPEATPEDDLDAELERIEAAQTAEEEPGRKGRTLLPDIEEIDGSLKGDAGRGAAGTAMLPAERRGGGRGFRLGFGLTVLLLLAVGAVYAFSRDIAEAVPALAPTMEAFAETVDRWRIWLDGAARDSADALTGWVDSLTAEEGAAEPVAAPAEAVPAEVAPAETGSGEEG